jgi:hypothetical protein
MLGGRILMYNTPNYTSKVQPPKPYNIEKLSISDGDVIILHLNENLCATEIAGIQKEIKQYFPNNQVICANEHILKQITVLHKTDNPFAMELDLGSITLNMEDLL